MAAAVPPRRKNGTSLPSCAAMSLNFGRGILRPASAGSASRTAAASLDPPPRPAPLGIRLGRRISTRAGIRTAARAARGGKGDLEGVGERDGLEDRAQLVVAIGPLAEDAEIEIDLG